MYDSTPLNPQINFSSLPIVAAGWRDVTALMRLEKICFSKDDAWPLFDIVAVLTFPNIVRLKIDLNNTMIAFIAVEKQLEKKWAWITTIGVAPEYRRHKLAGRLLSACEEAIKFDTIRLSVRRSNRSALDLYCKCGYVPVDEWPKYYIGGEDALILEKKI
ncbi:MAG: GNAT family N-acetyltransferase [Anaerolineaceae bacterium]|nr:GNAT family N-acetyltransferase [Anaerolineaceae bacterium]